jgi:thioredoxin-related protein
MEPLLLPWLRPAQGLLWGLLLYGCLLLPLSAATPDDIEFSNDAPLVEPLEYPAWFKLSFLDLPADLKEALQQGKRGIIVYFGQKHCPYCQKLLEVNFAVPDLANYTQRHFDLIPINIWGATEVTDMAGNKLSERDFSVREKTNFTPTLMFFDNQGKLALQLRGYYPPYQLQAALEYVADAHYRRESFKAFLERADPTLVFEPGELIAEDFFLTPPYQLDRSRLAAPFPLMVLFEQGNCYACEVLHNSTLKDTLIREQLQFMEAVQLDRWANTPVVTPAGERLTARTWADRLGLFYAPTLIFFDEQGREIIRVDSLARIFRLRGVFSFVLDRGYQQQPSFQLWNQTQSGTNP